MSITRLRQARQMYAMGQRVGRIAFGGGGSYSSQGGYQGGGDGKGISNPITAGTANTGGGGGGAMHASYPPPNGAAGGSGVVIVKEDAATAASSCWDLRQVYRQVKAGDWTN